MFRFRAEIVLGMFLMVVGCDATAGGVNIWDAVERSDPAAIKLFADSGGNLDVTNKSGETPLWIALNEKDKVSYEALLEYGADPNIIMSGRRVVTHWAATEHDSWWLRLALEHGADPNLVNTGRGKPSEGTPLKFAIGAMSLNNGALDNVKLLVEHGADIDQQYPFSCCPLTDAATQNSFDAVLYLLESGANYRQAECNSKSFLERIRVVVENRNRWFRQEADRKALDAVREWLEARGEDLGEPLPALAG